MRWVCPHQVWGTSLTVTLFMFRSSDKILWNELYNPEISQRWSIVWCQSSRIRVLIFSLLLSGLEIKGRLECRLKRNRSSVDIFPSSTAQTSHRHEVRSKCCLHKSFKALKQFPWQFSPTKTKLYHSALFLILRHLHFRRIAKNAFTKNNTANQQR